MSNKLTVSCTDWRPLHRHTLRGFITIHIAEMRLSIRDIVVHEKEGRRWVQLPSRPQLDRNQQLVRDQAGKVQYATLMTWDSRDVSDAFSARVVEALLTRFPDALTETETAS
jgi:hypothetical protein